MQKSPRSGGFTQQIRWIQKNSPRSGGCRKSPSTEKFPTDQVDTEKVKWIQKKIAHKFQAHVHKYLSKPQFWYIFSVNMVPDQKSRRSGRQKSPRLVGEKLGPNKFQYMDFVTLCTL